MRLFYGIFEAFHRKEAAQTAKLNCQERQLVATFLPVLPDISHFEERENQGNITNCFTTQNRTDLSPTSILKRLSQPFHVEEISSG